MKQRTDRRLPKPLGQAVTFGLVCLSWIFFRAGSAAQALGMLRQLGCGWGKAGFLSALSLMQMGPEEGLWILLSSFMVYRMDKAPERTLGEGRPFILLLGILAAWMVLLLAQRENAFLYFRF